MTDVPDGTTGTARTGWGHRALAATLGGAAARNVPGDESPDGVFTS